MKNAVIVILAIMILALAGYLFYSKDSTPSGPVFKGPSEPPNVLQPTEGPPMPTSVKQTELMTITSTAFKQEGSIPPQYTCDGDNVNPPLAFSNFPETTKSFALIMDDPDVPKTSRPDGNWDHWLMWNIPATTESIPENTIPEGAVVGMNTGGKMAYAGPCPPDREHRYFLKVYALDTLLELDPSSATKADIESAMDGHILDQSTLMGRYNRS